VIIFNKRQKLKDVLVAKSSKKEKEKNIGALPKFCFKNL
jgi:hypothetical protein